MNRLSKTEATEKLTLPVRTKTNRCPSVVMSIDDWCKLLDLLKRTANTDIDTARRLAANVEVQIGVCR